MGQVVYGETLSEASAGEVMIAGCGRGSYVLTVNVTSGGPVEFRLFYGQGLRPEWAEVTSSPNPAGSLAAGDAASISVMVGSWPSFKLTWDAAFEGTVTVTSGR